MRLPCVVFVLTAACGFDPSGPGQGGDGSVDAPALDAMQVDAMQIDGPPPSDGRSACPMSGADGYYALVGGSRYSYRPTPRDLDTANADCVYDLLGRTHLATFENGDLDAVMAVLSPGTTASPFVGAVCATSGTCDQRTSWGWVTGGAISDLLWGAAQPDTNTNTIGVARFFVSSWVLDDAARASILPYVCECEL